MTTDDIRILKTGTCPSLSGKSKLTYEIGAGPASEICMRITKNSGAGMFGKGWVELEGIHKLVNDKPITSQHSHRCSRVARQTPRVSCWR